MAVNKKGSIYHYRFMLDGTRYQGSTKETTPSKAKQFEAMLMARIQMGQHQVSKSPVLRDFAGKFIDHQDKLETSGQLAPATVKCYKAGWRLLSATPIAGFRLDRIGTADAAELTFPGGPSNANTALRTLSRMLSYACELNLLRAAPRIHLLEEVSRQAIIEPGIENLLLEYAPDHLGLVLVIMMDCGMRPEEVCRMRWEHIYWDRNVIVVTRGKSKKAKRFVVLSDRMRDELLVLKQANDSEWVFPSDGGKSGHASATGHRDNFNKAWTEMMRKVKARIQKDRLPPLPDDLVLYSARHTFATNFLAIGGDLAKLMMLMGHASITTTQKYLHPSTADAAEFINRHNRNKGGLKIVRSA
jgi:integrase